MISSKIFFFCSNFLFTIFFSLFFRFFPFFFSTPNQIFLTIFSLFFPFFFLFFTPNHFFWQFFLCFSFFFSFFLVFRFANCPTRGGPRSNDRAPVQVTQSMERIVCPWSCSKWSSHCQFHSPCTRQSALNHHTIATSQMVFEKHANNPSPAVSSRRRLSQ